MIRNVKLLLSPRPLRLYTYVVVQKKLSRYIQVIVTVTVTHKFQSDLPRSFSDKCLTVRLKRSTSPYVCMHTTLLTVGDTTLSQFLSLATLEDSVHAYISGDVYSF